MGIDEAFDYVGSARTPREKRQRKKEISTAAWDLARRYGPNLDDGSPNPKHDEALYEHGMRLALAADGLTPGVAGQRGGKLGEVGGLGGGMMGERLISCVVSGVQP